MEAETLELAISKKYTEFAQNVKSTLKDKLAQHVDCVAYSTEIDKMHKMKNIFAQINNPAEV